MTRLGSNGEKTLKIIVIQILVTFNPINDMKLESKSLKQSK